MNISILPIASTLLLAGTALAAPPSEGPYKPDWESLKAHQNPEWFRDAKLGIYTHWGPVTLGTEDAPHHCQWYGMDMYKPDNKTFKFHKEKFGNQKTFGYKDLFPLFTAPKFDPDEWAELFVKAGAKFAGPVAVHHDNYALWDSKITPHFPALRSGPTAVSAASRRKQIPSS